MVFALSKLLWAILRPSTLLVALVGLGLILIRAGRARMGMRVAALGTGALLLLLVVPADQWLLLPLENRFPAIMAWPERVDGIIVLGGAIDTDLTEDHGQTALNDAAERMTGFVALARHYPQARLAFAGGNGELFHGRVTESEAARRLFGQLGLDRPVIYEDRSRNTFENAEFLKRIVRPKPGETWVLITSASHLPRAAGCFAAMHWPVLPWPVGYKTGHMADRWIGDLPDRLGRLDWAMHEWVGLAAYRLMGRTAALPPQK